jgi:hypothetical protein
MGGGPCMTKKYPPTGWDVQQRRPRVTASGNAKPYGFPQEPKWLQTVLVTYDVDLLAQYAPNKAKFTPSGNAYPHGFPEEPKWLQTVLTTYDVDLPAQYPRVTPQPDHGHPAPRTSDWMRMVLDTYVTDFPAQSNPKIAVTPSGNAYPNGFPEEPKWLQTVLTTYDVDFPAAPNPNKVTPSGNAFPNGFPYSRPPTPDFSADFAGQYPRVVPPITPAVINQPTPRYPVPTPDFSADFAGAPNPNKVTPSGNAFPNGFPPPRTADWIRMVLDTYVTDFPAAPNPNKVTPSGNAYPSGFPEEPKWLQTVLTTYDTDFPAAPNPNKVTPLGNAYPNGFPYFRPPPQDFSADFAGQSPPNIAKQVQPFIPPPVNQPTPRYPVPTPDFSADFPAAPNPNKVTPSGNAYPNGFPQEPKWLQTVLTTYDVDLPGQYPPVRTGQPFVAPPFAQSFVRPTTPDFSTDFPAAPNPNKVTPSGNANPFGYPEEPKWLQTVLVSYDLDLLAQYPRVVPPPGVDNPIARYPVPTPDFIEVLPAQYPPVRTGQAFVAVNNPVAKYPPPTPDYTVDIPAQTPPNQAKQVQPLTGTSGSLGEGDGADTMISVGSLSQPSGVAGAGGYYGKMVKRSRDIKPGRKPWAINPKPSRRPPDEDEDDVDVLLLMDDEVPVPPSPDDEDDDDTILLLD